MQNMDFLVVKNFKFFLVFVKIKYKMHKTHLLVSKKNNKWKAFEVWIHLMNYLERLKHILFCAQIL